jgi:hypothetical protein
LHPQTKSQVQKVSLAELKAAAEAALPGPRKADPHDIAHFIALVSPGLVLELIRRLEAKEKDPNA